MQYTVYYHPHQLFRRHCPHDTGIGPYRILIYEYIAANRKGILQVAVIERYDIRIIIVLQVGAVNADMIIGRTEYIGYISGLVTFRRYDRSDPGGYLAPLPRQECTILRMKTYHIFKISIPFHDAGQRHKSCIRFYNLDEPGYTLFCEPLFRIQERGSLPKFEMQIPIIVVRRRRQVAYHLITRHLIASFDLHAGQI